MRSTRRSAPLPQAATIRSLPEAFEVIKEMQRQGYEFGEDYRGAGGPALAEILEGRMAEAIDRDLDEIARRGEADRRNGGLQTGEACAARPPRGPKPKAGWPRRLDRPPPLLSAGSALPGSS